MVTANNESAGDGIVRHVQYAHFRTDKPPQAGYSADLMHNDITVDCYDDFSKLPSLQSPYNSILDLFLEKVKQTPDARFLGTRAKNDDGTFGAYEWMSYQQTNVAYEEIAKGSKVLELLEPVEGINEDGKKWAFCGIWAKNRWEWHTTMLSSMVVKAAVVGFYDSMGDDSVDFCLKQTRMETMFVSTAYLAKILSMKEQGMATYLRNIVMFDTDDTTLHDM